MKITITGAEVSRWPAEMHIMITTCIVCSGCHPWHSADTVHTSHGFDGGRADIDAGMNGVMLQAASHDIQQSKIVHNAYVISMFPSLKLTWKSLR
jgi:hypothetical protein